MKRLVAGLAQHRDRQRRSSTPASRGRPPAPRSSPTAPGQLSAGTTRSTTASTSCSAAAAAGRGSRPGSTRPPAAASRIGRGMQRLLDGVVACGRPTTRRHARAAPAGHRRRQGRDVGLLRARRHRGRAAADPDATPRFAINTRARRQHRARDRGAREGRRSTRRRSALRPALERLADETGARRSARDGVVGGPAVLLDDFDQATSARFPCLVVVLVLVTFLVLLLAVPLAGAGARARCC